MKSSMNQARKDFGAIICTITVMLSTNKDLIKILAWPKIVLNCTHCEG